MSARLFFLLSLLALYSGSFAQEEVPAAWLTYYERSDCRRTPRLEETLAYCRRLDDSSEWVAYRSFGNSARGRELPLLVVSREGVTTPAEAARTGKALVLIQAGIHAGEIDGKDASLMLARDIAITRRHAHLLDHTIILFIPVFNVDGHERFGPYNRINQNGPEEMGYRVTARNLNLNRDYMKADTPEMRALLKLFTSWLPDLYVDCHVTDGIDFQYDVTYAMETGRNIDAGLGRWARERFLTAVLPMLESSGHPVFYYVYPREEHDLGRGIAAEASKPRLSTGYAALQGRPALLIETHALKPYRRRVEATYHFLRASLEAVSNQAAELRMLVRRADSSAAHRGSGPGATFPLSFGVSDRFTMKTFRGVESRRETSAVSGGMKTVYTGRPVTLQVPFYDDVTVLDSVTIPYAYLIPPEWNDVADVLVSHGIAVGRLDREMTLEVESYRFTQVQWGRSPYEGRLVPRMTVLPVNERRTYPRGSFVVHTAQRLSPVAIHLLEPRAVDSFVAWGFFNAIFEQKEYAEDFVMEKVGSEMLAKDTLLARAYRARLESDPEFASRPDERLHWLYTRSAWADSQLGLYPVGRVMVRAGIIETR